MSLASFSHTLKSRFDQQCSELRLSKGLHYRAYGVTESRLREIYDYIRTESTTVAEAAEQLLPSFKHLEGLIVVNIKTPWNNSYERHLIPRRLYDLFYVDPYTTLINPSKLLNDIRFPNAVVRLEQLFFSCPDEEYYKIVMGIAAGDIVLNTHFTDSVLKDFVYKNSVNPLSKAERNRFKKTIKNLSTHKPDGKLYGIPPSVFPRVFNLVRDPSTTFELAKGCLLPQSGLLDELNVLVKMRNIETKSERYQAINRDTYALMSALNPVIMPKLIWPDWSIPSMQFNDFVEFVSDDLCIQSFYEVGANIAYHSDIDSILIDNCKSKKPTVDVAECAKSFIKWATEDVTIGDMLYMLRQVTDETKVEEVKTKIDSMLAERPAKRQRI